MKCKACNDETNQIKAGKTKAGTQKYKCKKCGKYYTHEGKKRGHSEETKNQAIKGSALVEPLNETRETKYGFQVRKILFSASK